MRSILTLTMIIEAVLNKLLFSAGGNDSQIESARYRLSGKTLRIEIEELGQPIHLIFSRQQLDVIANWAGDVHCTIKAPLKTFPKLKNNQNISELIRSHALHVDGDTQVLQQFVSLTDLVDWNLADFLAPYLGDIAAYSVSAHMRHSARFFINLFNKQQNNVKTVIQDEWLMLPKPLEFAYLSERIADLVHDLDVLYNRVEKLDPNDDAR